MDGFTLALVGWAIGSLVFLILYEAATVVFHKPTISMRVRDLGRNASIVVIWASFMVGYLLAHFFDNFISGP